MTHHLGHIKGLGMSAEHGGFIRAPGDTKWTNFTDVLDMSWLQEVEEIFKYYTEVSVIFPHFACVIDLVFSLTLLLENDWKPHRG